MANKNWFRHWIVCTQSTIWESIQRRVGLQEKETKRSTVHIHLSNELVCCGLLLLSHFDGMLPCHFQPKLLSNILLFYYLDIVVHYWHPTSDAELDTSCKMTWRHLSKRILLLATPPLFEPFQSIVIRQAKQNHRQQKSGVSNPPILWSGHHWPLGHTANARQQC